jgi:hypothetical protein
MSTASTMYAYFWVSGFGGAGEEIGASLGLEPSKVLVRDRASAHTPEAAALSSWEYESGLPRDVAPLDAHIEKLLDVLEGRREAVAQLSKQHDIGINCVATHFANCGAGFHLSKSMVSRLAELGVSVDFDLYCYKDEEGPQ